DDAVLEEATWVSDVPADRAEPGTVSIGITTMNPTRVVTNLLGQIGGDDDVHAVLDKVYLVDQGSQRVAEHTDFAAAQDALRGKLSLIEQGNMGGSGGYARAQFETLEAGESTYMMCMDDDVVCAPDNNPRAR